MAEDADVIISKELRGLVHAVESVVKDMAGEKMGVTLLITKFSQNGRVNYASNIERSDMIKVFETLLKGWSEGMPDIPTHEIS